jgi:serine/threonine-protein kinase
MSSVQKRRVLSILALVACLVLAPRGRADVEIDFKSYVAIAFSPSTGAYGYAYNYWSRYSAEREALRRCPHADAKIVGWVQAGWLALAIGDDNAYGVGWEYGNGSTNNDAKRRALKECASRTTGAHLVLCICSGDVTPEVFE